MNYILSGKVNSGKSTALLRFVKACRRKNVHVAGWISSAFFKDCKKRGYDIKFISNSKVVKKMRLARDLQFKGGEKWKRFWFNPRAFKFAKKFIFKKCDIFVVDEIGPLELGSKKGFWPLLPKIYSKHKLTITVIRSNLLKKLFCLADRVKRTGDDK